MRQRTAKNVRMLVEGVGNPVWGTLLPYARAAAKRVVGIDSSPMAFGLYASDGGYVVPAVDHPKYFDAVRSICHEANIDVVIPAHDATLAAWSARRARWARRGIHIVVSSPATVAMCNDKWRTYEFFSSHQIPTPRTSLAQEFELIKPRFGEGGAGILRAPPSMRVDMTGRLSQEFVSGQEFSVDALCDERGRPLYVVPRLRLVVENGRSILSKVVHDVEITRYVDRILAATRFMGPVNVQGFQTESGPIFTEINPRISGGLSLSMAATDNWFDVIAKRLRGTATKVRRINYGLMMMRYLADCVVHERDLVDPAGELPPPSG